MSFRKIARKVVTKTGVVAVSALLAVAIAPQISRAQGPTPTPVPVPGSTDASSSSGSPVFQYPTPGQPVPAEPASLPPDDTIFMLRPAIDIAGRAGYAGMGDNSGYSNGGGVGVFLFLDSGRLGVAIEGQATGGQNGPFQYGQLDASGRARIPVDSRHIIWAEFGADISVRGSFNPHVDNYIRLQPVAGIGTMFKAGNECIIHLFARAAVGLYDTQAQTRSNNVFKPFNFDSTLKPSAGIETLAQCGTNIRFTGDFQHIFDFGKAGSTDVAHLEYEQSFPIQNAGPVRSIGFYTRFEGDREGGNSSMAASDPRSKDRYIAALFGGLEVHFMF